MPSFRLHAISGEAARGSLLSDWGISLRAEPRGRGSPAVTTGEALTDFLITVNLKPRGDGEYPRSRGEGWEKAIGVLYYHGARPRDEFYNSAAAAPVLILEFYLGETDMARLLEFARSGRLPREIDAEVEGVEYVEEPGSFDWDWDTATKPEVPLTSISFNIPLIDSKPDDRGEASEPATVAGADNLISELRKLVKWQKRTFYVLVVLGVILLFVLARF